MGHKITGTKIIAFEETVVLRQGESETWKFGCVFRALALRQSERQKNKKQKKKHTYIWIDSAMNVGLLLSVVVRNKRW